MRGGRGGGGSKLWGLLLSLERLIWWRDLQLNHTRPAMFLADLRLPFRAQSVCQGCSLEAKDLTARCSRSMG